MSFIPTSQINDAQTFYITPSISEAGKSDLISMGKSLLFSFFLLMHSCALAQSEPDSVTHSLYFVGDAGEPYIVDSSLGEVLRSTIDASPAKATVLFLGDNVYPRGMPGSTDKRRALSEKTLQTQVDWIRGLTDV